MSRSKTPLEILAQHQWPENPDDGGCSARDGWGIYANPPVPDNEQMAAHQLEMLQQAGWDVVRITTDKGATT